MPLHLWSWRTRSMYVGNKEAKELIYYCIHRFFVGYDVLDLYKTLVRIVKAEVLLLEYISVPWCLVFVILQICKFFPFLILLHAFTCWRRLNSFYVPIFKIVLFIIAVCHNRDQAIYLRLCSGVESWWKSANLSLIPSWGDRVICFRLFRFQAV